MGWIVAVDHDIMKYNHLKIFDADEIDQLTRNHCCNEGVANL